jgi:protocatechuate 3,4-dioxygenase beta subunit
MHYRLSAFQMLQQLLGQTFRQTFRQKLQHAARCAATAATATTAALALALALPTTATTRADETPPPPRISDAKSATAATASAKTPASKTWVKVSGRIINEENEPVAGAKVFLSINKKSDTNKFVLHNAGHPNNEEHITDKNGVWTCDRVPANADYVSVRATHSDYLGGPHQKVFSTSVDSIKDFYESRSVTLLERGVRLTGVVKDEKGKPVANAEVFLGADGMGISVVPYKGIKTDKQGKFSLGMNRNQSLWGITVSARAKGYAPDTKTFSGGMEMPKDLELVLKPPQTIRGIVVNEKGEPLSKIWFRVVSWKNVHNFLGTYERQVTDKNGHFEMKDAPEGEVLFAFRHKGYATLWGVPLKAGAENKIVLLPPTQVRGKVVDADTREEIKNYTVDRGRSREKEELEGIFWDENQKGLSDYSEIKMNKDGSFQNELTWSAKSYFYRASAKGYYTAVSEPIKMDGKKHDIVIKLHKGKELVLKITGTNGRPAANAEVFFQHKMKMKNYDGYSHLGFENGKSEKNIHVETKFTTDASGVIKIQPQNEEYRLVISHDLGRAIVSSKNLSADKPVVLSPWERIKGKSFIGSKPNAGAKITYSPIERYLYSDGELRQTDNVQWHATTITDKNGNFEIKHAIPKLAFLYDETQRETIRVIHGKVLNIQLGGKGRIVEGRAIIPVALKDARFWGGTMELASKWEKFKAANVSGEILTLLTSSLGEGRTEAEKDKYDLELYERYKKLQHHFFTLKRDGTFRILNVLPGEYKLSIRSEKATATQTFTVSPDPEGKLLDEPVVLPPVELKPKKT